MDIIVNRIDYITETLVEHFTMDAGLGVYLQTPDEWAASIDEAPVPHLHPLGFWPIRDNPDPDNVEIPLVFVFCPQKMDYTTAHLSDDQLDEYLDTVMELVNSAAAARLLADIKPAIDRWRWAEDQLAENAIDSLRLFSEVNFRAVGA